MCVQGGQLWQVGRFSWRQTVDEERTDNQVVLSLPALLLGSRGGVSWHGRDNSGPGRPIGSPTHPLDGRLLLEDAALSATFRRSKSAKGVDGEASQLHYGHAFPFIPANGRAAPCV